MRDRINRTFRKFRHRITPLLRDDRGATALFIAAGLAVLVGAIGLATDTARGYLVKSRLSQALDAAALAGGRVMFSPTRDADIVMYFNANFPSGYLGAAVSAPTIVADATGEKLTVSAQATLPTTFMRILGAQQLTVSALTEITRQTQLLDVVLAIDMSGSMGTSAGTGTRIKAARDAANELVNILFGTASIKNLLKIGVVPWNSMVNIEIDGTNYVAGSTTTQTVSAFTNPVTGAPQSQVWMANNSPVPLLSAPPPNWKGCVYARYLHNAANDDDADLVLGDMSTPTGDWIAWEPVGDEGEPQPGFAKCTGAVGGRECTPCLQHGITPLNNNKGQITAAIGQLTQPKGTTDIPQGLVWAWRVLMPTAPFTEADPNPPGRRQQAIVLLSDGENVGGSGDGYKGVFGIGSAAQPDMDSRVRTLAANIKASGVKIYTIQFANQGSAMEALLREIASGPDSPFYHYAPDGAALSQVFREVANHLSNLRLSK